MMPELIFLGVAVITFAVLLALRLHTRVLKARAQKPKPLITRVFTPCVAPSEAVDRQYGRLSDIQLEPLRLLFMAGHTGLPVSMLTSCYERAVEVFPEVYEGARFEHWLAYYGAAELVTVNGRRAYLTAEGRRLLKVHSVSRTHSPAA